MKTFVEASRYLNAALFLALAVAAVRHYRGRRAPAAGWFAASFVTLAVVAVVGLVLPEEVHGVLLWAKKLLVVVLLAFPYLLYRFAVAFEAPNRRSDAFAAWSTGTVMLATLALPRLPAPDSLRPVWFQAYVALVLVVWTALSALMVVRLWRAGTGKPTLARRRMRLLGLAAVEMNVALVLAGVVSNSSEAEIAAAVQILAFGSAVLFFLGFAPPPLLRMAWRRPEERALQEAQLELIAATTPTEVTERLLPRVVGIVGARAAVLVDDSERVLGSVGLEPTNTQGSPEDRLAIPLRAGTLLLYTTAHSPFFGREEVDLLTSLGAVADLALARCTLLSQEREVAAALEHANADLQREIEERKRVEASLVASEERTRRILETAGDAFVAIDESGVITAWNRQAELTFGWAAQEVIGRPLEETLIPAEQRVAHRRGLQRFLATGEGPVLGRRLELSGLHRDGHEVPIELVIWALQEDEGWSFNAFLRDISERKRAENALRERERQLAEAQALAHVGSWHWDISTDVVTWSDELFRMYGLEPQSVAVTYPSFLESVHPEDRASVDETVRHAYLTGEPFAFDHRIVRPDGSVAWCHGQGEVVTAAGQAVRMVGTAQDVTERKQTEDAVRQAYGREHEARVAVQRANADLEALISSVSHDLKSPIISFLGYLEYLKVDFGALLPPEGLHYLDRMSASGAYMQALIQDLLELARVGRTQTEPSPVDLGVVLREVSDELRVGYPGATIEIGAMPVVSVNSVRARQVLTNVVGNAVQHAGGSDVHVSVVAEPDDDGGIRLCVLDDGPGIPPAYREKVFGVFERLESAVPGDRGTGMGLAITRKIMETIGGAVWVGDSETGTKLWLRFPAHVLSARPPARALEGAGA